VEHHTAYGNEGERVEYEIGEKSGFYEEREKGWICWRVYGRIFP